MNFSMCLVWELSGMSFVPSYFLVGSNPSFVWLEGWGYPRFSIWFGGVYIWKILTNGPHVSSCLPSPLLHLSFFSLLNAAIRLLFLAMHPAAATHCAMPSGNAHHALWPPPWTMSCLQPSLLAMPQRCRHMLAAPRGHGRALNPRSFAPDLPRAQP